MSDKKAEAGSGAGATPAKGAGDEKDAKPSKKKLPIKVIGIVAVLMIVEAGAVFVLLGSGKPQAGHAETDAAHLVDDESEKTQELELVTDKFQNLTSGEPWVWDLSIFLQIKNKHADQVGGVLEQRQAEIKEGLGQIVGRARHSQLIEPERQTLTRQVGAFLAKIDGTTVDGKPLVERVIISKCRGFKAD